MCSRAIPRPQVGPKTQTVPAIPSQPARAPSKFRTKVCPTSRLTHSSKIVIQEASPLVRPNGAVRDRASFLEPAFVVPLHDRDELEVVRPEFIPEEPVDIRG